MRKKVLILTFWAVLISAEARYYNMAYAGFRVNDPTTEEPPQGDDQKDRMGVLYRDPTIYQPSYYHHKEVQPIEESAEIETYPLSTYSHAETYQAPAPPMPPTPPPPTAAPAAPEEKRQQPYSYYYIGRKLWYVPLYFSLYFVIYVAALIIRAISRHKVTFPDRLPTPSSRSLGDDQSTENSLNEKTADINQILEDMLLKYM
ncbi:uncharacterized protein LOC132201029 [Neocloeon triangulifer]|uniref:uncharacterized protein LOC132201029 n=1 Tax=Neocloeon triangulifer TaxID=2078957 RepID=UPI00286FA173|nr:uncharacterized protein LOC132201029 [Neocloeon triangulifer]